MCYNSTKLGDYFFGSLITFSRKPATLRPSFKLDGHLGFQNFFSTNFIKPWLAMAVSFGFAINFDNPREVSREGGGGGETLSPSGAETNY